MPWTTCSATGAHLWVVGRDWALTLSLAASAAVDDDDDDDDDDFDRAVAMAEDLLEHVLDEAAGWQLTAMQAKLQAEEQRKLELVGQSVGPHDRTVAMRQHEIEQMQLRHQCADLKQQQAEVQQSHAGDGGPAGAAAGDMRTPLWAWAQRTCCRSQIPSPSPR